MLEIRDAGEKGRGLFAAHPFRKGDKILDLGGTVYFTAELPDDLMALQIGNDRWLCSDGSHLDDYANHSCDPNAGFTTGELALFALKGIAIDEEITWDYSTSINEPNWLLECRCESPKCRRQIRPWHELTAPERMQLEPIALAFLRKPQFIQ